jgi:hypothetical protein
MGLFRERRRKRRDPATCARCATPLPVDDHNTWCSACRGLASQATSLKARAVVLRDQDCEWGYWYLRRMSERVLGLRIRTLDTAARAPGGVCPLCGTPSAMLWVLREGRACPSCSEKLLEDLQWTYHG